MQFHAREQIRIMPVDSKLHHRATFRAAQREYIGQKLSKGSMVRSLFWRQKIRLLFVSSSSCVHLGVFDYLITRSKQECVLFLFSEQPVRSALS